MQRLIAIVTAILAVAGLVSLPASAQAAESSTLTYATYACGGAHSRVVNTRGDLALGATTPGSTTSTTTTFDVYTPDHQTRLGSLIGYQDSDYAHTTVPPAMVAGVTSFSWRVRVFDGSTRTSVSAWCNVPVDNTLPGDPVITSAQLDARHAVEGSPLTFEISGGGSDVYAYQYDETGEFSVADPAPCASQPFEVCAGRDGAARATIIPPSSAADLCVQAVTAALVYSGTVCLHYDVTSESVTPSHSWVTGGAAESAPVADTGSQANRPLDLTSVTWAETGPRLFGSPGGPGPSLSFGAGAGVAKTSAPAVDTTKAFSTTFWLNVSDFYPTADATVLRIGSVTISLTSAKELNFCATASSCTAASIASPGWHFVAAAWEPRTGTWSTVIDSGTPVDLHVVAGLGGGPTPVQFGGGAAPLQGLLFNPAVYPRYLSESAISSLRFIPSG